MEIKWCCYWLMSAIGTGLKFKVRDPNIDMAYYTDNDWLLALMNGQGIEFCPFCGTKIEIERESCIKE